jgi:hypothetical protein
MSLNIAVYTELDQAGTYWAGPHFIRAVASYLHDAHHPHANGEQGK